MNDHDPADKDFRLLFEQSPDLLLVLLPDAPRFTMVGGTDARFEATHTTRDTLGKGLFEVFPDNPDDQGADGTNNLRASLERVVATRKADTMPVQKYDIRGPDGGFTTRYWSPKNIPVLSADGQVRYILHRVEEVTELVRADEAGAELRGRTADMEREVIRRSNELSVALRQLREANAKLAEQDVAKTNFFSNISHEFRTPLTLMLAPLEDALSEPATSDADRERLTSIHRNALRLLKLVNTLLDFARIEAGRTTAHYEPVDLGALTAELASTFRSAIERGGLAFTVDCPPLPEHAYVDREMWEKIVLNLLSNAFKHTLQGGITVRLRGAQGAIVLTVEDTGIGIAADEIPRLFERFHRVKGATSRSHEGTGIGLSLVQELVQLHGGSVRVESEPGRGSRFIVRLRSGSAHLPAESIGQRVATREARTSEAFVQEARQWLPDGDATAPATRDATAAERPRILWADDNTDMRHYVCRLLERDYEVTAVTDGQAALGAALADPPDLVLTDMMMPRLDGAGLLKALRADERTRRLPVILLSARAGEEASEQGLAAGADDYLVKPFAARELLARVRAHVLLSRERRSWEAQLEGRVHERTAELQASTQALAEENARRQASEKRLGAQLERMSLLDQITRAIAERHDLRSIFQVVVRSVEESLPVKACWIGLLGADTEGLQVGDELFYAPDLRHHAMPLPPPLAAADLACCVSAPLRGEKGTIGVLMAGRTEAHAFSSGECEFLRQLAEHVGLAAQQAQLRESLLAAYEELRQTQQTVLQQERLSALGQMASGIAHDINNAITPAMLYLEAVLESETALSPRGRQSLPLVLQSIEDVAATVARLREFYRPRETQATTAPVELNPLIEQVVDLTRAKWSDMPQRRGIVIHIRKELATGLPAILGSQSEMREALTNLVFNAVDAMPDGGTLTLRTSADAHSVLLEVADTGIGMTEETRRKCLEPFFTTKGERGTGLGLAMVYGIVKRHSAELDIQSRPGEGTTLRIRFPRPVEVPGGAATQRLPVIPQDLRLLLIDDDPHLLKPLREILELEGHRITTAGDGATGLEVFRNAAGAGEAFDAVITDLGMPRMDGRAVAKGIKDLSPGTPVILLTGWGQRPDTPSEKLPYIDRVVGKPPKLQELRKVLAECCAPAGR
jgi:signal transduction histidine kinase/DNA-binding response OmpR family regulator